MRLEERDQFVMAAANRKWFASVELLTKALLLLLLQAENKRFFAGKQQTRKEKIVQRVQKISLNSIEFYFGCRIKIRFSPLPIDEMASA